MTDIDAAPGPPQPQPVPTTVALGQGRAPNGSLLVMVQVATPTGLFVFFLDQQAARSLARNLGDMAGGIITATADQLLVPGRP